MLFEDVDISWIIVVILNLVVLILEGKGLSMTLPKRKWRSFVYYTQLSNIVAVVSSVLLLIFGFNKLTVSIRFVGVCMLVMTVFVTTCVLIPMGGKPKALLWTGNGLYHHFLCPVLSTFSYIVFEEHAAARLIPLPVIVTLAYGLIMLYLNAKKKVDGPYPFFRVRRQSKKDTVLWMVVLTVAIAIISSLIWLIARFF